MQGGEFLAGMYHMREEFFKKGTQEVEKKKENKGWSRRGLEKKE